MRPGGWIRRHAGPAAAVTVAAVVAFALGCAAGAVGWPGEWSWGSVPGWIEALGTGGALLIAAAALMQELRYRRERERKVQAELVDALPVDIQVGQERTDGQWVLVVVGAPPATRALVPCAAWTCISTSLGTTSATGRSELFRPTT